MAARADGPFQNLQDLLERCDPQQLGAKAVEHLIKGGALDSLSPRGAMGRAALYAGLPQAADRASAPPRGARQRPGIPLWRSRVRRRAGPSSRAHGEARTRAQPGGAGPEWDELQRLAFEKEALGFYLSGHPLGRHEALLKFFRCASLATLDAGRDGQALRVGGVLLGVKQQVTKRGESMARLTLEDLEGVAEVIVWPRVLEAARPSLQKEAALLVRGPSGHERGRGQDLGRRDAAAGRGPGPGPSRARAPGSAARALDRLKQWAQAHPRPHRPVAARRDAGKDEVVQKAGQGVPWPAAAWKR